MSALMYDSRSMNSIPATHDQSSSGSGKRTRPLLKLVKRAFWFVVVPVFVVWLVYSNRTVTRTYDMKWVTGPEASFATMHPEIDKHGNRKVLLLFPSRPFCFLYVY